MAVCGVGRVESVAVTVKVEVPVAVGVPVMAPVLASSDRPAGSEPVVTAQVTGGVAKLTCRVALYPTFTVPADSEVVVITMTWFAIVMLSCLVADMGVAAESWTFTVKVDVPAAVGVPEIAPLLALSDRPFGRLPVVMLQERFPVPPLAAKVAL